MSLRRFNIQTEFTEDELERIRDNQPLTISVDSSQVSGHTIRPEPARQATVDPGGEIRISTGRAYHHTAGPWNSGYPIVAITGKPTLVGSNSREHLNDVLRPLNCRAITSSNIADSRYASCLVICGTTGVVKIRYFVRNHLRIFSEYSFYEGLNEEYAVLGIQPLYSIQNALRRAVTDEDMFTYIRRA
jgi:hypothetical protein